jgi:hypothetical protein
MLQSAYLFRDQQEYGANSEVETRDDLLIKPMFFFEISILKTSFLVRES